MMPENSKDFRDDDEPLKSEENSNGDSLQDVSNSNSRKVDDDEPLTTQGNDEEVEENMSGTTNLTIEQLKKARDPGYNPESPDSKPGL